MKKFKFRLERILQYRKIVKDDKLRELLHRQLILQQNQAKLEEIRMAYLLNEIERNAITTAEKISLTSLYSEKLSKDIDTQTEVVTCSNERVDEAIEDYIESAKDEESLKLLKDKRKEVYMEEFYKAEQQFLDELTTLKGNVHNKVRG